MSSSMVYGNFDGKEVDEETNCSPIGIYGALKYSAEKIINAYSQVFDLNYTIIRPSALYGERCISRRVGQIFIENALFRKKNFNKRFRRREVGFYLYTKRSNSGNYKSQF